MGRNVRASRRRRVKRSAKAPRAQLGDTALTRYAFPQERGKPHIGQNGRLEMRPVESRRPSCNATSDGLVEPRDEKSDAAERASKQQFETMSAQPQCRSGAELIDKAP